MEEILKAALAWAKAEVFSSQFFIFFGILFLSASIGFWQLGKSEIAKAYIFPTLVAGVLLLALGLGMFFSNKARVANFEADYKSDPSAFVKAEISRTEKTMGEYSTMVFKVFPIVIILAAMLFMFVDKPLWRAISSTTIAFLVVILLVDNNANARIDAYNKQLLQVEKQLRN